MNEEPFRERRRGQVFGVAVWVAMAAGGAVLTAAGASNLIVAVFALLAVAGLVVLGVRATRQR